VRNYLANRRRSEEGFTLIELMVVVLIMGILMAIAIPTFLATQGSANDASAKSDATNALTNEKAYYEDNQVFEDSSAWSGGGTLSSLDPNLSWTTGVPSKQGTVSAIVGSSGTTFSEATSSPYTGPILLVEAYSSSGNCFYIYNNETNPNTPVLGYAETTGGCAALASTAFPGSQSAVTAGHAGANAPPTATTGLSATSWYTKW
jgi:type IV pilus assembly protein PilA